MWELVFTPRFNRSYARYVRRNQLRRKCVDEALARLRDNPFDPRLRTHPLSGEMAALWASSCGYNCRILFAWERERKPETLVLVTIGTHDEVY